MLLTKMFFSKLLILVSLLSFSPFVHAQTCLVHNCFGHTDFPDNKAYEEILATIPTRFNRETAELGNVIVNIDRQEPNKSLYGLAKYWGSIVSEFDRISCRRCISRASLEVRKRCPQSQEL